MPIIINTTIRFNGQATNSITTTGNVTFTLAGAGTVTWTKAGETATESNSAPAWGSGTYYFSCDNNITSITGNSESGLIEFHADLIASVSESIKLTGCANLTKFSMLSVTSVTLDIELDNCTSLTEILLPELLTIRELETANLSSLKTLTITKLITHTIGFNFLNNTSIEVFSAPALTTSGQMTFQGCTLLYVVYIPVLTTPGSLNFTGCSSLGGAIVLAATSCHQISYDGTVITSLTGDSLVTSTHVIRAHSLTTLISVSFASLTSITFDLEFFNSTNLISQSFPLLESIGRFVESQGCTNLTTIDYSSLTTIVNNAIWSGAALTESSVNSLLIQIWNDGTPATSTTKHIDLSGGTSSAATGSGATSETNLEGVGWTIPTN